jgi:aryl-alcohol dehydrogenase-like predicted oxidoreductase
LTAWQAVEAIWTSKHLNLNAFISYQNEYSLLVRDIDQELIPAMQAYGLGLLPFYPLAGGMLTGKYKRNAPMPQGARLTYAKATADRYLTDENWSIVERLESFSARRGHSLLELAVSWLAARPTVSSVIAGATKPEQVEQNIRAADWKLTPEDLAEIDRLTRKK